MNKAYTKGQNFWENEPSLNSPINENNLNDTGNAIDIIDDRVITLDATKANQSDLLLAIKTIEFNETTGVFTITRFNDTQFTIDTKLEKIAVNFNYNASTQQLILTLVDGTTQEIDLSALITQYEFENSARVSLSIDTNGNVSADLIAGTITSDYLEPNYLANVTTQASNAAVSETNAAASALSANTNALLSKSYAVGNTGARDGENTDNAKYYSEQARQIVGTNVESFNGRTGVVIPQQGDYDATQVMYSETQTVKQKIDSNSNNGHTIKDETDTSFPRRDNLKFINATVSDNEVDNETMVELSQNINIDNELNSTSSNPVENKVILSALDAKVNTSDISAANTPYSNSNSGLGATNVQTAIDEVASRLHITYTAATKTISVPVTAGTYRTATKTIVLQ